MAAQASPLMKTTPCILQPRTSLYSFKSTRRTTTMARSASESSPLLTTFPIVIPSRTYSSSTNTNQISSRFLSFRLHSIPLSICAIPSWIIQMVLATLVFEERGWSYRLAMPVVTAVLFNIMMVVGAYHYVWYRRNWQEIQKMARKVQQHKIEEQMYDTVEKLKKQEREFDYWMEADGDSNKDDLINGMLDELKELDLKLDILDAKWMGVDEVIRADEFMSLGFGNNLEKSMMVENLGLIKVLGMVRG